MNAPLAATIVNTTLQLGVRDYVVCAGARNVPLISDLAARDASEAVLWHHFDERAAAFFALGMAKASHRPVAVVTTSGTAVAELLPAVVEAWYSGVPLILITADRPPSYRGSGAPQAIEQAGIFYGYVSEFFDIESPGEDGDYYHEIAWDRQSPLHLNVCFSEPVEEPVAESTTALKQSTLDPADAFAPAVELMPMFEKPVAILGELAEADRAEVRDFLLQSGLPVWCEATSGLREDPALAAQRLVHESQLGALQPSEVLRIGGVPSLRFWRDLESMDQIRVLNFSRKTFPGLARPQGVHTFPIGRLAEVALYPIQEKLYPIESKLYPIESCLDEHPGAEPTIVRALSRRIPEAAAVFLGNSLPIREWNAAADFAVPHPHCYASRGANGIDGELSAYYGMSAGYEESWGIFGDLTTLYDMNAPWIAGQLPAGRRRIAVLNNSGGRIFSRLPAMRALPTEAMALAENQHELDFSAWAEQWRMEYHCWDGAAETWPEVLGDHAVIEVKIDQQKSEAYWEALASRS